MEGKLDRVDSGIRDLAATLARLPSKEFLIGTVIAALGIAIAIAALTFNIADYASKTTQQAEQAKAAQPAAAQPIIITLPAYPTPSTLPAPQAPAAQAAPLPSPPRQP